MARNGSGTMSVAYPDFVAGTTISSDQVDANFATIVAEITNSIAADGQTTASQRIPFASGISSNTVAELTSGAGVTVDGLLIKDGRSQRLPFNFIGGLRLAQAADTDHDITIAAGDARDPTDAADLTLAAAITKQIDAAWVVGTNQGGMDTSTVANTTLYAVWLIKRSDTSVVDALFSTSFSAPTMPASYDYKRLIGAVKTNGSANIIAFVQRGDEFWFTGDVVEDIDDATITDATFESGTVSCPPNCLARLYASAARNSGTPDGTVWICVRRNGAADSGGLGESIYMTTNGSDDDALGAAIEVMVDGSSLVQYAAHEGGAEVTRVRIKTRGFRMLTRSDP